jgi:hypothetical protein
LQRFIIQTILCPAFPQCVFIPSEDGEIPPTAEKYRKQVYDFLKKLDDDLDLMLKLGSSSQIDSAKKRAAGRTAELPALLFKATKFVNSNMQG